MKSIREDSIMAAFTTMLNKLFFARDNIPCDPCGRIAFFIVLQIQAPALGRVG